MRSLLLIVIAAYFISGCSASLGHYQVPCDIEHVSIRLRSDKGADAYCSSNARLDPGETIGENTYAKGCAFRNGDNGTIVIGETDNVETLVHEIRHLLDWFCKLAPGAENPQNEWNDDPRDVEGVKQWVREHPYKEVR